MGKRLPPNTEELIKVASLLEAYIPLDEDLMMEFHTSMKGNTAVRINGVTYGVRWFMDMYKGPWFYISVPKYEPTTANNNFSMIALLGALLKG